MNHNMLLSSHPITERQKLASDLHEVYCCMKLDVPHIIVIKNNDEQPLACSDGYITTFTYANPERDKFEVHYHELWNQTSELLNHNDAQVQLSCGFEYMQAVHALINFHLPLLDHEPLRDQRKAVTFKTYFKEYVKLRLGINNGYGDMMVSDSNYRAEWRIFLFTNNMLNFYTGKPKHQAMHDIVEHIKHAV